ncbi:MAG: hybrid-cluster NAD(P)-dependent oxidoreductase [Amphritea sp.]
MSQPYLSQINIYPVKSTRGMSLSRSWIEKQGLSQDRRLMLSKVGGGMVTARTYPQLLKVKSVLLADGLRLTYPQQPDLHLRYSDFTHKAVSTEVWDDHFEAFHTTDEADLWFSSIIGEPVILQFSGEHPNRMHEDIQQAVGFVDEFPALLISEGSLQAVNERSQRNNHMEQFRPNLVIANQEAFEEDGWKRVKIGDVIFDVIKPCERCILTTAEIGQDRFHDLGEPLSTLAKFRAAVAGGVFFGQNSVPLNEGMVQIGDIVEVLETQEKQPYPDNGSINFTLKCVEREIIAQDFCTLWFEMSAGDALPDYLPGQHLPILLDIDGKSVSRRYTLSSSPSRLNRYAISVKRVSDGLASNWLHEHLQEGSTLIVQNPAGNFHLGKERDKILLLSGGSGVTPMLSILRYLADHKQINDVVFYHQCRTQADIPCYQELQSIAADFPTLTIHIALSQADGQWQGLRGRFSAEHAALIPQLTERQVFVCGPNPFMDSVKTQLLAQGLPPKNYHQEAFTATKPDVGESRDLYITLDDKSIPATNQRTLLEHAESAGIKLPNSCRAGVCGACKVTLTEGEYIQVEAPALSDEDRKAGKVLACCCTPMSDVVLSSEVKSS